VKWSKQAKKRNERSRSTSDEGVFPQDGQRRHIQGLFMRRGQVHLGRGAFVMGLQAPAGA